MPIERDEFLKKTDLSHIFKETYKFLSEHSDMAYTSDEIAKELEVGETKIIIVLERLDRIRKVKTSRYKGNRYFTIAEP